MIYPSRRIKRELSRRVSRTAGRKYRNFYDIRWDEYRECLCIFERKFNGAESIRRELREGDLLDGAPRQAHMGDIEEILSNLYGRQRATDDWYKAMQARRAERDAKRIETRKALASEAASEVLRVLKHGLRSYSIPSEEKPAAVKVTDTRRFA